jgi:hypothetical protein
MSNFIRRTKHPESGLFEDAEWLDNYFGGHRYGVRFPNGSKVWQADDREWEFEDDPTTPQSEEDLDRLLDAHAEVYARTTMQYITEEVTEEERDKEWHHSDLKTKHAIQRLKQQWELEARLDEQRLTRSAWHGATDVEFAEEMNRRLDELLTLKNGEKR